MNLTGPQTPISPEHRMLKNERKRVEGYIRSYQRNPSNWNKPMIASLERLALQYQIPFKRHVPTATGGALGHAGAFAGGLADSIALGFIPDNWYSSEATRTAANVGKIGGTAAQIAAAVAATVMSGGAAAPTIGAAATNLGNAARAIPGAVNAASGVAKLGAAARGLGGVAKGATQVVGRLPMGAMTGSAIQGARGLALPHLASRGNAWAIAHMEKDAVLAAAKAIPKVEAAVKSGKPITELIKGVNFDKTQMAAITKIIKAEHGPTGKIGKALIQELKGNNLALQGLSPEKILSIANNMRKNAALTVANIQKAAVKGGGKISGPKAQALVDALKAKDITKMDAESILKMMEVAGKQTKSVIPQLPLALTDMKPMEVLGAGFPAMATAGLASQMYTPSREDLESSQDPYDPYNY